MNSSQYCADPDKRYSITFPELNNPKNELFGWGFKKEPDVDKMLEGFAKASTENKSESSLVKEFDPL